MSTKFQLYFRLLSSLSVLQKNKQKKLLKKKREKGWQDTQCGAYDDTIWNVLLFTSYFPPQGYSIINLKAFLLFYSHRLTNLLGEREIFFSYLHQGYLLNNKHTSSWRFSKVAFTPFFHVITFWNWQQFCIHFSYSPWKQHTVNRSSFHFSEHLLPFNAKD